MKHKPLAKTSKRVFATLIDYGVFFAITWAMMMAYPSGYATYHNSVSDNFEKPPHLSGFHFLPKCSMV